MPKRKHAVAFRRRPTANKRRKVVRRRRVPRPFGSGGGLPLQRIVKLRYIDTFRLSPGLAGNANYLFRCNSLQDPDQSGTGHQYFLHDQLALQYNHYKVIKNQIKIMGTSTTNTPTVLGIRVTDDTTVENSIVTAMESGKAHYKVMASDQSKATITHGYNANKMFRNSGKTSISAQFGANPTEEAYFHVFGRHLNSTATGSNIDVLVELNVTAVVWEPKDIGGS